MQKFLNCRHCSWDADADPDRYGDIDIEFVHASDLMSDVLRSARAGALLLTGQTNNQTIRTAKIAGISAVVFVRAKIPAASTFELAQQYKIPILTSELSMFDACGILYANGIKGVLCKKPTGNSES
ncbi:MAG: transcriptional regulator [Candidatus Aminicenantes bacterium]|nr:transcriptional regulator [Candidatus Aminicenantes bacterium]NIM82496.1 transcriptional regulator [Candidatus Aminicenantes bacterium]NIN19048.1 transcriptional regulator [Candidatus Aminicenantes bacterium]NIN42950.1 transcriptional regulator [Candidatus Aminicenantes bacterium]NIN85687.1 transcriptional regulator [Candidatus Aminicenantes bacterium]